MKIFYTNFSYWRKLSVTEKSNFLFLATSYTVPKDYDGLQFKEFVPNQNLFKEACQHFSLCNFEKRYTKQIYNLNQADILNKLRDLSQGKDIVFLVWEPDNKPSERDIFMPWILNIESKDIHEFSLEYELTYRKNNTSFFEI